MATKPKIPKYGVPFMDTSGVPNTDWFNALAQQSHSGEPATSASAGAATLPATPVGFITIYVNGAPKLVPFYDPA